MAKDLVLFVPLIVTWLVSIYSALKICYRKPKRLGVIKTIATLRTDKAA